MTAPSSVRRLFVLASSAALAAGGAIAGCSSSPVDGTPDAAAPAPTEVVPSRVEGGADASVSGCAALAALCQPFDLGPGTQHDCVAVGKAADEAACTSQKAACLTACTPAEGARLPVTVRFTPGFGNEPFSCGKTYANVGAESSSVTPVDFRAYVQDVVVLDEAGKAVPVKLDVVSPWQNASVALLDFEDGTGGCKNGTAETNTVIKGTVPFGKYRGVGFTLGVPEAMNHMAVDEAPSPANLTSMYWGWLYGHIFLASGVKTVDPTDGGAPDAGDGGDAGAFAPNEFFFHVGSVDCSGAPEDGGAVVCDRPNRPSFVFPAFELARNVVVADLKAALVKSKLQSTMMGCHSFSDVCIWPFEYLGLNFVTGSRTPTTQTFFRVQ